MSVLNSERHQLPPFTLGALACVAVAIAAVSFGDALLQLVSRWDQQEQYSHGYLVPLVSLWLLWSRRHQLTANLGRPSYLSVAAVAVAVVMAVVGELGAVFILSQLGFILSLVGIVLAFGGFSLLRVTLVPIAYLLFAIPLPYFIDAKLTLQLQLISSELGVAIINLWQIPVYLEGNIIDLGSYKLQVAEACSGLRYVYPLLSVSALAAYLFHARFWQRALVFLSAIPIAILMNGLRIGLVGILVDRWGIQMAEGVLHFLEGWTIFVACAALLTAEMALLAALSRRRLADLFHVPQFDAGSVPGRSTGSPLNNALFICLGVLVFGAAGQFLISGRSEIVPERARFASFPMQLAGWTGRSVGLDRPTEQALKMDDYLVANYADARGRTVNLYVAYYASQRKNESPHSPVVCLPGSGWLITQFDRNSFRGGQTDHPFNRVVIQNESTRDLVYYWFEERGRSVADEYTAKWRLLVDAISENRSDGALIRVTTEIRGETDADADRRLEAFMRAALPVLWADYLPRPPAPASASVADLHSAIE